MSSYFDKYVKYKNKYLDLEKSLYNKQKYSLKGGSAFAGSSSSTGNSTGTSNSITGTTLLAQDNTKINEELEARRVLIGREVDSESDSNKVEDYNHKLRAYDLGREYLNKWLQGRTTEIQRIHDYCIANPIPDACTFNDLYKWTMMPVIRRLESIKGNTNPIIVTFGIDIREPSFRKELSESAELRDRIHTALRKLEQRRFNRENFVKVLALRPGLLDENTINSICGGKEEGRRLVQENGVKSYGDKTRSLTDNDVTVNFYFDETKTYKNTGERGCHFIEATGPWHKVTWLETSLMQCVYQAKLEYDLGKKGISYEQWLYGALLRCATSVAYTHLIQEMKPNFMPALFTNRRTGSQEFNILQSLFFTDHFKQFRPPVAGGPISTSTHHNSNFEGKSYVSLGASSVESWNILGKLGLPCLGPAGTHAHELSMVISRLFPELDRNYQNLPITQVVSHYLYYKLVWERTGKIGPMPMLPDTLGTRAFMKAATYVMIDKASIDPATGSSSTVIVPFLDVITSARQDSGRLEDFQKIMGEYGYNAGQHNGAMRGMMASEIESTYDLMMAATKLNYGSCGAGGFYGDNQKVWGDLKASMNSMAVKPVSVFCDSISSSPIKIGDPSVDSETTISDSKLSLDNNLSSVVQRTIKEYATNVRRSSYESVIGTESIHQIFNIEYGPVKKVPSSSSSSSSKGGGKESENL